LTRSAPRNHDDVARLEFGPAVTQGIAQYAFDPVTPDGVRIDFA